MRVTGKRAHTRVSGRHTKQPTRQPLSHKEGEKERCGVQVGRTEIRIKNASRRVLARRGFNTHARERRIPDMYIWRAEWRGSPKRGHSICSVENNITCTHCSSCCVYVCVCICVIEREREKKEMASRAEGMMKKAGGHAVRSGQSRRTHEHPVPLIVA